MSNSQRPTGIAFIGSYSGMINIAEEVLNLILIVLVLAYGPVIRSVPLLTINFISLLTTAVLLILHIKGTIRRSKLPCHWIEFGIVFVTGVLIVTCSTIAFSEFTARYIAAGIIGYFLAMVYFVDTFDKYQVAVTPAVRYAWTTPNMPDLN